MNYIIKGILKRIFTQFLYIDDQGLDIESGIIKLPYGHINHEKIDKLLKPHDITIIASSYKNLIIHIPII